MSENKLGTCDDLQDVKHPYDSFECQNWQPCEPAASPQATRPERVLLDELGKLEHRQLRDEHGREIKGALWVKLHDVAGIIGRWAAQPAAGTTPQPLPCGCECMCDCGFCEHCRTHIGATFERLCAAERKLAEHGIVWEEVKGYVFNGKP